MGWGCVGTATPAPRAITLCSFWDFLVSILWQGWDEYWGDTCMSSSVCTRTVDAVDAVGAGVEVRWWWYSSGGGRAMAGSNVKPGRACPPSPIGRRPRKTRWMA